MRRALILFAHGSRDPRWAAPFEAVAERVRDQRPELELRVAFLEHLAPSLAEATAELSAVGCTNIAVVPMFLGAGGHVQRDLPRLVTEVRAAHPSLRVTLHTPVGELPEITRAMASAALALADQSP